LDQIIESVEHQGIAYEVFAFYNLFFGEYGLFNEAEELQNATIPEGATNATGAAAESTEGQEEGFL